MPGPTIGTQSREAIALMSLSGSRPAGARGRRLAIGLGRLSPGAERKEFLGARHRMQDRGDKAANVGLLVSAETCARSFDSRVDTTRVSSAKQGPVQRL